MTDRQLQCLLEQNGNRTDFDAGDRADLAAMREELVQRGAQGTRCYCGHADAMSGGEVYHARWMAKLGVPPIPLWTVDWFFDLRGRLSGRGGGR